MSQKRYLQRTISGLAETGIHFTISEKYLFVKKKKKFFSENPVLKE
jgi:hypothetical protein